MRLKGTESCPRRATFSLRVFLPRRLQARISHQAASNTDNALAHWCRARKIKDTVCSSSEPITVQAGLRVRKLALHSNSVRDFWLNFRRLELALGYAFKHWQITKHLHLISFLSAPLFEPCQLIGKLSTRQ
jgi:hypothetical protein